MKAISLKSTSGATQNFRNSLSTLSSTAIDVLTAAKRYFVVPALGIAAPVCFFAAAAGHDVLSTAAACIGLVALACELAPEKGGEA